MQKFGITDISSYWRKLRIPIGIFPNAAQKPKTDAVSLHDFFHNVYLPCAKPRKVTWKRDIELFKRIDAEVEHKKLQAVSRHEFSTFMTKLLASGLAPASVNHHAKLAKRLLTVACQFDMASGNQLSRIPMFAELNQKERYMSDAEVARLVHVTTRATAMWQICRPYVLRGALRFWGVASTTNSTAFAAVGGS